MLRTIYFTRATIVCFSLLAGGVSAQASAQSSSSASGNDNRQEMSIHHSHNKQATSGDHHIRHSERDILEARASDESRAQPKLYRDARTGDVSDNRRAGSDRDADARRHGQEQHSMNERGRQSDDRSEKHPRDNPSRSGSR